MKALIELQRALQVLGSVITVFVSTIILSCSIILCWRAAACQAVKYSVFPHTQNELHAAAQTYFNIPAWKDNQADTKDLWLHRGSVCGSRRTNLTLDNLDWGPAWPS